MAPQSRGKRGLRSPKPQQSASTPNLRALPHALTASSSPNRTPLAAASRPLAPTPPSQPLSPLEKAVEDLGDGLLDHANVATDEDEGEVDLDEEDGEDEDNDFFYHYSRRSSSSTSSDSSISDSFVRPLPRRASLPYILSEPFAPPFYNRPPTPLPPSPSLTSLLRPTFSNTTSRPTTPDSSDGETPNDTEAVVAKSARTATTVPRASPKVPTYEYYGFVLHLVSSLAFLIYLLWSYLPSPFLYQLGISYYPNRWWSLAIPSFLVMTIVYIYVALASYNTGYLTLPMTSIENLVDETAHIVSLEERLGMAPLASDSNHQYLRKGISSPRKSRHRSTRTHASRKRSSGLSMASGFSNSQGHRQPRNLQNPNRVFSPTGNNLNLSRQDYLAAWDEGTDAVMDVPLGAVCEILYDEAG